MKNYYKRLLSLTVAGAMLAMTACEGKPADLSQSGSTTPVAMGRYVESDCELPAKPTGMLGLGRAADGTVSLFGAHEATESWELFFSDDNGDSWSVQHQELIGKSGLSQIGALCAKPEGGIVIAGEYYSPEFEKQLEEFQVKGGGYSEDFEWPPLQVMDISPDGTVREIPIALPDQAAGYINRMALAPDGELAIQSYREVYRYDRVTGALLGTITLDSPVASIALNGGKLAVMSGGIAYIYDFVSGDLLETVDQLGFTLSAEQLNVSSSRAVGSLVAVGEDGAFYFCTSEGIYRKTADGDMVERVLDGSLSSLGTPSIEPLEMAVVADGFLVMLRNTSDDSLSLKKYRFDPDVPTLPDKTLRIYALAENKTVRQTMGEYQLAHPDTHVLLEVAPEGMSASDAVRALNTQLLAGMGPDILVLDGMTVDAYIEKKVLMPLDESVCDGTQKDITGAARVADGKLYHVPVRFALPAMTVPGTVPRELGSITALVDMIVAQAEALKGNENAMVLQNCGGAVLLNSLYPLYEQTLQTDGKPDEAKLRGFLEQLKRITDLQNVDRRFVTDASPAATLDMQWNSLSWCIGIEAVGMGNILSYRDFANTTTAVERVPQSRLQPMEPDGNHTFIPLVSLGVCAGSQNTLSATEFIKLALSLQIQEYEFSDGLPVNGMALENMLARNDEDYTLGSYGMSSKDGEVVVITVKVPSARASTELRGWIDALDTPTHDNRVIMELLRSETTAYFEGRADLDSVMSSLWQKLKLIEAE